MSGYTQQFPIWLKHMVYEALSLKFLVISQFSEAMGCIGSIELCWQSVIYPSFYELVFS